MIMSATNIAPSKAMSTATRTKNFLIECFEGMRTGVDSQGKLWHWLTVTEMHQCITLPLMKAWLHCRLLTLVPTSDSELQGYIHPYLHIDMSEPPPGKQSKTSRLLRPIKGLFSRRSRSPSYQGAPPRNTSASTSASPTNSTTSAPQVNHYTAILELSTTPSGSLTWEHQMKEWGSTAYEGLKTAIQGIYDCSGIFPPLQTTAGVLLTISKAVDVSGSVCSTCKCVINISFCPSESFSE